MRDNLGVSLATLQFADWQQKFLQIAFVTVISILVVVQFALARPRLLPRVALLVRKGYRWALWPTLAQFVVGPVALFTLPETGGPMPGVWGTFGISILVSIFMVLLMHVETRRPAPAIGRSFGLICSLMLVVVALMGAGRHLYREAAISPHRELVRAKTQDYKHKVEEARREAGPATGTQPQ